MIETIEQILDFWENEVGPQGWYMPDEELDKKIAKRFMSTWQLAAMGEMRNWQLTAKGCLALIILCDQFPRNMFRGDRRSFATDRMSLCVAKKAIRLEYDKQVDGNMRQFFYMPLMHSESPMDQDYSVRMFLTRMPSSDNLLHARAHRQVIRDFGRFPFRNVVMKRESTSKELNYLGAGGYGATVDQFR